MAKQLKVGESHTVEAADRAPDQWTTEGGHLTLNPNGHSCEIIADSVTPEGEPDVVFAAGVPVLRVNVVAAPDLPPVSE